MSYTITTDKFDALYKRLKPKGVTMTALLAKAAGVALAQHPVLYACEPLCLLVPSLNLVTLPLEWFHPERLLARGAGVALAQHPILYASESHCLLVFAHI